MEVFTLSKTLVFKTVLPFLGCSLKEIIQRKGKKKSMITCILIAALLVIIKNYE